MLREFWITGAGSGLGKAVTLALARNYPVVTLIHAFDIIPAPQEIIQAPSIQYQRLDITDAKAISAFVRDVEFQRRKIDLWIHCAGVRGLVQSVPIHSSEDVAKAETLAVMDTQTMIHTFEVNALGFLLLAQAFTPSLLRSVESRRGAEYSILNQTEESRIDSKKYAAETTKVVILGSRMGSIGHNMELGGGYAYRASKAALNAIVKSLSIDVPQVAWTVIHPGRVETRLVSVKEDGAMTAEECIQDLLPMIERLDKSHSGRFLDRFGQEIPW